MCYFITWYEEEITANDKIRGFKIQFYQAMSVPAYNLSRWSCIHMGHNVFLKEKNLNPYFIIWSWSVP